MDNVFVIYYEPFIGLWVVKASGMTSYATAVLFEPRPGLHMKFIKDDDNPIGLTRYTVRYDKHISQHYGWERTNSIAFKFDGEVVYK